MSYGYKEELMRILDPASGWIPRLGVQGCLVSATLGEEVQGIKGLVLRNPVSSESIGPDPSLMISFRPYSHCPSRKHRLH
jgi:ATP-dependent RNA helicase DDX56/DBP9